MCRNSALSSAFFSGLGSRLNIVTLRDILLIFHWRSLWSHLPLSVDLWVSKEDLHPCFKAFGLGLVQYSPENVSGF